MAKRNPDGFVMSVGLSVRMSQSFFSETIRTIYTVETREVDAFYEPH